MFAIRVVSNAGPLIWLARSETLWLLKRLYDVVYIPAAVFSEVIGEGVRRGYPDAQVVKEAVEQSWIKVKTPSKKAVSRVKQKETKLAVQIGIGEREAIALGIDLEGTVLTNDEVAFTIAKTLGIDVKGILFLLLLAVQSSLVDRGEARRVMQVMLQEGFWLSPDHVLRFYEALEQIKIE